MSDKPPPVTVDPALRKSRSGEAGEAKSADAPAASKKGQKAEGDKSRDPAR